MLLGLVLKCSIVTKSVRYLLSESASLREMDSDVATNFTLALRTGGSEGAWGENLTAQSFRKTKWILEKTFSFSNEVFITLLW